MTREKGVLRVGTSGYQYDHWAGAFYPPGLPQKDWLEHYAQHFDTVEINNTFYHLPDRSTFESWGQRVPSDFLYAVKFSRYGSHIKRLKAAEQTVDAFVQAACGLGKALGPILVQLPPRWKPNHERLRAFVEPIRATPYRWAFEFRDPRWLTEPVFAMLRESGAALVIHDLIPDHPRVQTADWTYRRFHGDSYAGSYSPETLKREGEEIRGWLAEGRDVYAYFNNDAEGHAPRNALELLDYAG